MLTLPREALVRLGVRVLVPGIDGLRPNEADTVDVGGGIAPPSLGVLRPTWRMQDPAKDPREPRDREGQAMGTEHGWANCNMTSCAVVYAYHVGERNSPWGGDMRHSQSDREGGTDMYDAVQAWRNYGDRYLSVRSGQGWKALKAARREGRAILIHGTGEVPGRGRFAGNHACVIGPEVHEKSGRWLFGDPLASDWQFIEPAEIRAWAEALNPAISFAVSKPVPGAETGPDGDDDE